MASSKHWVTSVEEEANIKTTLSGPASIKPVTLNEVFKQTTIRFGGRDALCVKRDGVWKKWTWREYYSDVCQLAKSFVKAGLEPHHGVCIIGFNSPEWVISFMAAVMAGGTATGIYATNNADACHYIVENCKADIFIAENKSQLSKILEVKDRLPKLKAIVQYTPGDVDPAQRENGVVSWKEFMELGKEVPEYEVQWRMDAQKPSNCAALVYTSGTTGAPKGVMLSHDNLFWTANIVSHLYKLNEDDHIISYLPLSHVAAMMLDIIAMLVGGNTVWFAQPDALKGSIVTTLNEVRPTIFLGVPRVWEKFKDKVELVTSGATGIKGYMLSKSRAIGKKTSENRLQGGDTAWGYFFANNLVFKGLKAKMGLDRCRVFVSGAAPLPRAVTEFFLEFDMPIYQIYGMSECTGPHSVNLEGHYKLGSAGKVLIGVENKIDNPGPNGDGEICFRGRHVFMGYLGEEAKTRETIDEDGWLHSGDIGRLDEDGHLFITGRIKEILITRGGENVAPVPIEEAMLVQMKLLSNCMVIGDEQRFLTMFVTIRCKMDELDPTDELDQLGLNALHQIGSQATTVSEAIADPLVERYIKQGMERANELSISRAACVQKFRILPVDFSIPGGELTPTMKVKRKIVLAKYHDLVAEMYKES